MMERTEYLINQALTQKSCVFLSGGVDSLVLLHLVCQIQPIPVISFLEDFSKSQIKKLEEVILKYDLTLYSYPPNNRYFVPNGNGISLIDEYGFSSETIPVVRDLEDSDTGCLAELSRRRLPDFSFGFDTVLTGILKSDLHPLFGNTMEEIKIQDNVTFVSPLWDWSKGEVQEKAEEFGLTEYVEEDDLRICSKCLYGETFCPKEKRIIPGISWNPDLNLQLFREKFGVNYGN